MGKNILIIVAVFVCGLALVSCGKVVAFDPSLPPGNLYDIGGYRLHLQSQGSSNPTVVMEAGSMNFCLTWALVAPEIAKTNRVVTYDRAGLGWSEESPYPRFATIEAVELHKLLQAASINPPYILVGHSQGGVINRVFAHTYPTEVVGMVLVDPGHEEQKTRQEPDVQISMDTAVASALSSLQVIYNKCLAGTLTDADVTPFASAELPANEKAEFIYIMKNRPQYWKTGITEASSMDANYEGVKTLNINSLGSIPLIVISSTGTMEMATTPEYSDKCTKVIRELEAEVSRSSTNGSLITAEGSTHFIQLVQPQIVINAIKRVINSVL